MATLKERLTDWRDWDCAAYEVGACLGFWTDMEAPPGEDHWNGVKGIMWSNNPLGNAIYYFLDQLVEEGMLERREEPNTAYRWNSMYKT
jgi:hypothetical protein